MASRQKRPADLAAAAPMRALAVSSAISASSEAARASTLSTGTRAPSMPFVMISAGPDGQSVEMTEQPHAMASTSAFGNPSNLDDSTNISDEASSSSGFLRSPANSIRSAQLVPSACATQRGVERSLSGDDERPVRMLRRGAIERRDQRVESLLRHEPTDGGDPVCPRSGGSVADPQACVADGVRNHDDAPGLCDTLRPLRDGRSLNDQPVRIGVRQSPEGLPHRPERVLSGVDSFGDDNGNPEAGCRDQDQNVHRVDEADDDVRTNRLEFLTQAPQASQVGHDGADRAGGLAHQAQVTTVDAIVDAVEIEGGGRERDHRYVVAGVHPLVRKVRGHPFGAAGAQRIESQTDPHSLFHLAASHGTTAGTPFQALGTAGASASRARRSMRPR